MIKAFTWGTFNIIHYGHLLLFRKIKSICDEFHIILIPDNEVFLNKKYVPKDVLTRKKNIAQFNIDDHIHVDSHNMGLKTLLRFNPDIFVLGYDQNTIWEEKLISFIKNNRLGTKIIRFGEFADGIHSSDFR